MIWNKSGCFLQTIHVVPKPPGMWVSLGAETMLVGQGINVGLPYGRLGVRLGSICGAMGG